MKAFGHAVSVRIVLVQKKRPNAETSLQNALKEHLLDFGLGKLKRKLLLSYNPCMHSDSHSHMNLQAILAETF